MKYRIGRENGWMRTMHVCVGLFFTLSWFKSNCRLLTKPWSNKMIGSRALLLIKWTVVSAWFFMDMNDLKQVPTTILVDVNSWQTKRDIKLKIKNCLVLRKKTCQYFQRTKLMIFSSTRRCIWRHLLHNWTKLITILFMSILERIITSILKRTIL